MQKLLILGVSGLLGVNLAIEAEASYELVGVSHQQLLPGAKFPVQQVDLEQSGAVRNLLEDLRPDAVINCTALASLEACEKDPVRAQLLNVQLPAELAQVCHALGIALQQISTDAVFDGQQGNYREDDPVKPLSVYAQTKWAGEEAVRTANPAATIARVNFFGWSLSGTRSLAEFFFNRLVAMTPMQGIIDRYFNPLHVTHLSQTLLEMLELGLSGTFHIGSPFPLSKYEFGLAIADIFDLDESLIEAVSSDELGYQAARSPNLTMNVEKLTQALGHEPEDVFEGLQLLKTQHTQGYPQRIRALRKVPVT